MTNKISVLCPVCGDGCVFLLVLEPSPNEYRAVIECATCGETAIFQSTDRDNAIVCAASRWGEKLQGEVYLVWTSRKVKIPNAFHLVE